MFDGAEVKVVFLESYGATAYERGDLFELIHPARKYLEQTAAANGRQVLSARVRAATIARRLRLNGFIDGVNPPAESLGHISELSLMLLAVFNSGDGTLAQERPVPVAGSLSRQDREPRASL